MKRHALIPLVAALALAGCSHDKYDVSSAEVKKAAPMHHSLDPKRLPPGTKIEDEVIPAGATLPDGTVAEKPTKIQSFTAPLPPGGP